MRKLSLSKGKSNRDNLCIRCWIILTYEQTKIHKEEKPEHSDSVVTSKHFSTEEKFIGICKAMNRCHVLNEQEYFPNPFNQSHFKNKSPKSDLIKEDNSYNF